jgi:hypothetical protein
MLRISPKEIVQTAAEKKWGALLTKIQFSDLPIEWLVLRKDGDDQAPKQLLFFIQNFRRWSTSLI